MQRFGLLGFGSIAEHGHLPALQSFSQLEVVAVADISPGRRARARELLPNAEIYESPEELIARADVQGVDICAPPSTHADLIVAACERGVKDIVCEKPFVLFESDYRRVSAARDKSGARVVSVNNWQYSDLYGHVSTVLRAGEIGTVRSVELRTGRPAVARGNSGWLPNWRTEPSYAGGGIILDHGWHQLYLLMGWVGEPIRTVRATSRTVDLRNAPVEDEAVLQMGFESAIGRIELAWTSPERTNGGSIRGSNGTITVHDDRISVSGREGKRDLPFTGRLTQSSYHPQWFEAMFRTTVLAEDRVEANRNFKQAGDLVSVIRAAYESATAGGSPRVPLQW